MNRLYYISFFEDYVKARAFEMIARMEYEGRPLYVELNANCDYSGFDCQGDGFIIVGRDANLFMKDALAIERENLKKDLIYKSLQNDSIHVEEV